MTAHPTADEQESGGDNQASAPEDRVQELAGTVPPTGEHEWCREDASFLYRTTRHFAASLDYESTLSMAAQLALPTLGSWCIVDLVESDGRVRRLGIIHPDPEKQRLAAELLQSWPPSQGDVLGVPRAVSSGKTEVLEEIDDAMLIAVARDEGNLRTLRALGIGSLIVVPLSARGHVLGALTLVSDTRKPYTASEIALAEDLAARCAMAIDNARLYRDAREAGAIAARMNEQLVIAAMREQELTEQAQASNTAKSGFLAAVSHEIRTPLNAISGFADLLEIGIAGPLTARQREYLARIKASGAHLIHLVEDILDLAKVEAGKLTVQDEAALIQHAVNEAVMMLTPQASTREIAIAYGGDEGACYRGDPDRVRQILINLLSNALKFTQARGSVTLRFGATDIRDPECRLMGVGPWVFARVMDSGIGIARDMQESVFEPFVQVERRASLGRSGTGLGLAISRELARRMGGDITLRSALGSGSCFTLWLPAFED